MKNLSNRVTTTLFLTCAVLLAGLSVCRASDPYGIVTNPIPDKVVCLTFDDGCASHYTVAFQVLKSLGLGGTIAPCDFDSFNTRKDWYMTWAQIREIGTYGHGIEIGNHSKGHGSGLGPMTDLENEFLANGVPLPTSIIWPLYQADLASTPTWLAKGYTFARGGGGGHEYPYDPTVHHPLNLPAWTLNGASTGASTFDTFVGWVQRAVKGKIVVICIHGVPDMEHPPVGTDPMVFTQCVEYLKANNYKVISMHDIGQYVDAVKAATVLPLPAATPNITILDPALLATSSTFSSSNVVCVVTVAGAQRTFTGTGAGRVLISGAISGNASLVLSASYVLELAPSSGANALTGVSVSNSVLRITCTGINGAPLTLQDSTLQLEDPLNTFATFASQITLAGSNTVQSLDSHGETLTNRITGNGSVSYTGSCAIGRVNSNSDYTGGTRVAQDEWLVQNADNSQSTGDYLFGIGGNRPFGAGVLTIAGTLGTRMGLASGAGGITIISNAVVLESPLVFSWNSTNNIDLAGTISGTGSLVKVFAVGDSVATGNPSMPYGSALKLRGNNTYSGGTRFYSGNLLFYDANSFGTGPVTLGGKVASSNHALSIRNQSALTVTNAFELAGITDATINGTAPTFAGVRGTTYNNTAALTEFNTTGGNLTLTGPIGGSGGLLKLGINTLALTGSNTYAGPTKVGAGTLVYSNAFSLGGGALDISSGAKLQLSYSGTQAVGPLTFNGGSAQAPGTYGSSTSPAANKNDTYFSGPGTVTVLPTTITTLALTDGSTRAALGAPLTFTATVSGAAPTGTVVFYAAGKLIGTAALYCGPLPIGTSDLNGSFQASLTTSNIVTGFYDVTARYAGDANNRGSVSAPVVVEVGNPYVTKGFSSFSFPGQGGTTISGTNISVTVPYTTAVTALSPTYTVDTARGASGSPASGTTRNFTTPQTYTVIGQDGSSNVYSVAVIKTPVSSAKDILSMTFPGSLAATIAGTNIAVIVPLAASVTALAPAFTLSSFATASPASGTSRDFTSPQTCTVTAQDGSTKSYLVTVAKSGNTNSFTWTTAVAGNWSSGANWTNNFATGTPPAAAGQADYILNFTQPGSYTVNNDLNAGFQLNQLNLRSGSAGLTVVGNGITFTRNSATGLLPVLSAVQNQGIANINNPISLPYDLNVNMSPNQDPNVYLTLSGLISGAGALILNSYACDYPLFNNHDVHYGIIRITSPNTYSGGTLVNGGKIILWAPNGLGTGPVTISNFGTIQDSGGSTNALTINSGYLYSCTWNGPVTLNGTAYFYGNCNMYGGMSGPGGLLMLGTPGTYLNMTPGGTVTLYGANTYAGPTTVFPGTLVVKKAAGLYNADTAKWTPANIAIYQAATLRLSVGGSGEFSGPQLGTLLENLTTGINNNGLMTGSFLVIDTANATGPITVSSVIKDSQGPGGGWFSIMKTGAGTLVLTATNTFTGPMIIDVGTLSVASINSVAGGATGSSLGAPVNVLNGTINFGSPYVSSGAGGSGSGTLVYTGTGETTDREISINGATYTTTFDQSGTGLLKFAGAVNIPGFGTSKTIVLQGSTAGTGEIAGNIVNPYDPAGVATTALTKSGTGTWTLSGNNTYFGPTLVTGGILACSTTSSLGNGSVSISTGARLALNYAGTHAVAALRLNNVQQGYGIYGSSASPATYKNDTCFSGIGTVTYMPPPAGLTNSPATGVTINSAVLKATFSDIATNYAVYVCWSTVNGGTNAALWARSAYVGTWTNVASTNLSYAATGLTPNTTYYFTFHGTNGVSEVWATNVLSFTTVALSSAKDILSFGQGSLTNVVIVGTNITWNVPYYTTVTNLAPAYTVSTYATGSPPSGATNSFTSPQSYTVTAQDGSTRVYSVTVVLVPFAVDNDGGPLNLSVGVARLRGSLTSGPADVRVCWGTADGGTNLANWANAIRLTNAADGPFSRDVSNLLYGLTYYYRCYASNTYATAWAPATTNFTTLKPGGSFGTPITSGLALWLDASQLTGLINLQQVNTWTDLSAQTNHAIRQGGSSAGYPQYVANQVNGKPVMRFNSGNGNTGDYFRFNRLTTIRSVFWVLKENAGTSDGHFLLGDDTSYDFHRPSANGPLWEVANGWSSANIRNGTTRLMGTTVDGTATALPASQFQLISLVTAGNVRANQIAQDRTYHGSWQGDIAEILIYTNALSTTNEALVGGYLAAKYGLSAAYPAYTLGGGGAGSSLTNAAATGIAATSGVLSAALGCTGAVYHVYACWNTVNGGTNTALWTNSAYVGSWTNVASTNLSYTATGLAPSKLYYYTFRATNALDTLWASNVQSFTTLAPPLLLPVSGITITNGVASFTFTAAAGYRYRLDYKDVLTDADWTPGDWSTNTTGGPLSMTLTDPDAATRPHRFYKLAAANP